jgi:hypothetical protein
MEYISAVTLINLVTWLTKKALTDAVLNSKPKRSTNVSINDHEERFHITE